MKPNRRITRTPLILTAALYLGISPAFAERTTVTWNDADRCDPLSLPFDVDELGRGFPSDELINTDTTTVTIRACPTDDPEFPNEQVLMINETDFSFDELWYVADPETSLSNYDGFVNGQFAFRIDREGINRPLVSESIVNNGIFEPGEAWEFIIDDYMNTNGVGAWVIDSIGVPSDARSSGSIIAVPEPASFFLLGMGVLAMPRRRRARSTT